MIKSTSETPAIAFADLESFVRERAQSFIQNVLEEEVEELLGRRKSERRETGDPVPLIFLTRRAAQSCVSCAGFRPMRRLQLRAPAAACANPELAAAT